MIRRPTRWVAAPRWAARSALAVMVALMAYGGWRAQTSPLGPRSPSAVSGDGNLDAALYRRVAERMHEGDSYYTAARQELEASGYPTRSVFNFRFPTLAWLLAAFPSPRGARVFLSVLAALTLLLWFLVLRRTESFGTAVLCCSLLVGLLAWPVLDDAFLVHEVWAGILIALSIAALADGRTATGIVAGAAALSIRELALPYVCLALGDALRRGRRREAWAWAVVIGGFGIALAAHAAAVRTIASGAGAAPGAWIQLGGWPFVLKTAMMNAWLIAAPPIVTAIVLPLALGGLAGWSSPLGTRVAAVVAVYAGAFLIVGQTFNHMWGFMYSGLALVGLAFAPAAIRDLLRAAWIGGVSNA